MPTPEGLNTTTLHGKFVEADITGTPLQGTLTFSPNPGFVNYPIENVIVAGTETVTLDVNGEFTLDLVSTDNVGSNPSGWLYSVSERIVGQRPRTYNIALPYNSGVTVELSDVVPSETAPTYIPVVGPQGAPGVINEINGYSTAVVTLDADDVQAVPIAQKGAALGVATLDASSKIPLAQYDGASVVLVSSKGMALGVATLGGTGLIPSAQLDLASSAPPSVGVAAVGVATKLAREDHTHAGVALSGDQTVAGNKTFSGSTALTGSASSTRAAAADSSLSVRVSADSVARLNIRADGLHEWGTGSAAADVNLYRSGVGVLSTTGQIISEVAAPTAAGHLTRKDYIDNNFVGLTGAQTISGVKTFSSAPISQAAAAGTAVMNYRVTGDTVSRLAINADGTLSWGAGNAAADVVMTRVAGEGLNLNIAYKVTRAAANNVGFGSLVTADTFDRYRIYADGLNEWGPGNAARDTNLYRSAANVLKTDDSLVVAGTLSSNTTGINYRAVQSGSATVNFSAVAQSDAAITFPVAFASIPTVIVCINNSPSGSGKIHVRATGISETGFTMRFATGDSTTATTTGITGVYMAYVA